MIQCMPEAAAGLLMDKELEYLFKATQNPPRPAIAILGGAKVSDKIEVIENLMKFVDRLLIGGAMAYTFLKAKGRPVGKSLVEEDKLDLAKRLMDSAGDKLVLPVDHVVAAELREHAPSEVVTAIPDDKMGLDIGPKTIEIFSGVIKDAKTIIWNGPMGVFEKPPFDTGTVAIGKAVAASGALSVVGGGDSEKAVKQAGVADKISHISTGGGASLEFLAGMELPGVAALTEKK
jgi:phosphoglycerate kinase